MPECVAFSPNGKDLFAGGICFFGAWTFPKRENWFLEKGCPLALEEFIIDDLTSPSRGNKIAYTLRRNKAAAVGDARLYECKLIIWDQKASLKDEVTIITKNKFGLAVAMAFSDSENLFAHWNSDTKDVVIQNISTIPKELAVLDLKLKWIFKIAFSPDEKSLWILSSSNLGQSSNLDQ
jgi:WD40 repeat protein